MADLSAIIKLENKSTLHHDIQGLFTVLGDEPTVYPCHAGMLGKSHYFLQYKSSQAATYACNLSLDFRDIRVLPLGQHPYLYHQYRLARQLSVASGLIEDPNSNTLGVQQSYSRGSESRLALADVRKREVTGAKHRSRWVAKVNDPTWTCITPYPSAEAREAPDGSICRTPTSNSSYPGLRVPSGPSRASVNEPSSPPHQVDPTPFTGEVFERITAYNSSPNNSEATIRISALEDAPASTTLPINCETTVIVNLFDQLITYDLKANDSDPRVVIELLKAAKSERTTYLTAAAFYRRSGNPQSAKAVLTSMLEEFAARGVGAEQLKHALLYLSGCELELAKLAKAEKKDSSIISKHYAAAQTWLQKVFGVQDQLRAPPHAKNNQLEEPFKDVNNVLPSRTRDASQRPSKPIPDRDAKRMEREIQSLRDRSANQVNQLSQLRSTKRKLEDDCLYEQDLRRKYQRQLDDLREELDSARKMEKYALEQITREVAARRKAQETVLEMKTALGLLERRYIGEKSV